MSIAPVAGLGYVLIVATGVLAKLSLALWLPFRGADVPEGRERQAQPAAAERS